MTQKKRRTGRAGGFRRAAGSWLCQEDLTAVVILQQQCHKMVVCQCLPSIKFTWFVECCCFFHIPLQLGEVQKTFSSLEMVEVVVVSFMYAVLDMFVGVSACVMFFLLDQTGDSRDVMHNMHEHGVCNYFLHKRQINEGRRGWIGTLILRTPRGHKPGTVTSWPGAPWFCLVGNILGGEGFRFL